MAPVVDEPGTQGPKAITQQGKEESLNEGSHREELGTALPFHEARAFESQLGFAIADGDFDLPTAVVSENDTPGIIDIGDWLLGDQYQGLRPLPGRETTMVRGKLGKSGTHTGRKTMPVLR